MTAFRLLFLLACCCAFFSLQSWSDTLHLRTGVQVHGVVLGEEGNRLVVRTGDRIVRIPRDSVLRIDENDKDGSFDRRAAQKALEAREQELFEQTGLTREQREEIRVLIRRLDDSDPVVRGEARRTLTVKAGDLPVFTYITEMLPSILPVYVPSALEVLVDAGGMRARDALYAHVTHLDYNVRGAALELLGVIGDEGAVETMMRGLLDHAPPVRMAACSGLAAVRAREATPLLIENLEHADLRVQNYVREALTVLWSDGETVVAFDSAEEWRQFWNENRESVPATIDIESLEPLVDEHARFEYC